MKKASLPLYAFLARHILAQDWTYGGESGEEEGRKGERKKGVGGEKEGSGGRGEKETGEKERGGEEGWMKGRMEWVRGRMMKMRNDNSNQWTCPNSLPTRPHWRSVFELAVYLP